RSSTIRPLSGAATGCASSWERKASFAADPRVSLDDSFIHMALNPVVSHRNDLRRVDLEPCALAHVVRGTRRRHDAHAYPIVLRMKRVIPGISQESSLGYPARKHHPVG